MENTGKKLYPDSISRQRIQRLSPEKNIDIENQESVVDLESGTLWVSKSYTEIEPNNECRD